MTSNNGILLALFLLAVAKAGATTFTQSTAGALSEDSDRFGSVLATGDFNGDGFADLVASAPYEDTSEATDSGILFVFYGSANGLSDNSETITQNSISSASNEDGDRLGSALAVGNFNGDEYDDLAVGLPYEDTGGATNTGMVAILFGSTQGLLPSRTEAFTQDSLVTASNESGDRMGWSLAVGNFNGDNYDDLAVGIPYEDTAEAVDAGLVGLFYGSEQGLLPASSEALTQNSLIDSTNEGGDYFGFALATGDFNGDSYDDLAVGVPGENTDGEVDTGLVGVFFGSARGIFPTQSEAFTQNSIDGSPNEEGDQLGRVLTVGDFDNDHYDDLAIGAAYEDSGSENAGSTYVMYGSVNGLLPARSEVIGQRKAYDTNEKNDFAGSSLATGDFDGDGFDDLIVGVPGEDIANSGNDSGTIQAFFGCPDGLLGEPESNVACHRSYWAGQVSFGGIENNGDRFGAALATGDFDNNGKDDLAAGAPEKDLGGATDAGAVYVQEIDPALPVIDARAAIVMNRDTGEILGSKMPDLRLAMASTTKIMTALLAVEAIEAGDLSLEDMFTVSENAATCNNAVAFDIPKGDSVMGLQTSDRISLEDLLYGTMIKSGNDAAIAVAEAVSGPESAFITSMNLRALQLGLSRTVFLSPYGRDPEQVPPKCVDITFEQSINLAPGCGHYSTTRDLARLADYALEKHLFEQIVSTERFIPNNWFRGGTAVRRIYCNTNQLVRGRQIGACTQKDFSYEGAYGVKTGTTENAGECLVFAAKRNGSDLLGVVLGSTRGSENRYRDSTTILDFAFGRAIEQPLKLDVNVSRQVSGTINGLRVSFTANIGRRYRIEKSTNLIDWEPLETGIQGSANIERSFPSDGARCFIRVREE